MKLDNIVEFDPEPILSEQETMTSLGPIKPGHVIGLRSRAYGEKDGEEIIDIQSCAYVAMEEEYDEIIINGTSPIHQKIFGGIHGDIGTVAVTIHTIPHVIDSPAGIRTMLDLPIPSVIM